MEAERLIKLQGEEKMKKLTLGVANNREKGPGYWKVTLQKPKRFDYKASLGGCTWERNGIKFIKIYILSFFSSGPLCTWLQWRAQKEEWHQRRLKTVMGQIIPMLACWGFGCSIRSGSPSQGFLVVEWADWFPPFILSILILAGIQNTLFSLQLLIFTNPSYEAYTKDQFNCLPSLVLCIDWVK